MSGISNVVFRAPGEKPKDPRPVGSGKDPDSGTNVPPTDDDIAVGDAAAAAQEAAKKRQRKRPRPVFPVEVTRPHPEALRYARALIGANPSYSRIRPGDTPGSVIVS